MIREWLRNLIFETVLEVLYYTGLIDRKTNLPRIDGRE